MFFRQRAAANATLSYFFGCAGQAKAAAVDVVAGDEDWFIAEAEKAGVRIAYVIDTHVHADHYPGHQAGSACGAGLSGKPASTIGFEQRFNPMLSLSREAFVDALTAGIPPQPVDMARIVDANLRGRAPEPLIA